MLQAKPTDPEGRDQKENNGASWLVAMARRRRMCIEGCSCAHGRVLGLVTVAIYTQSCLRFFCSLSAGRRGSRGGVALGGQVNVETDGRTLDQRDGQNPTRVKFWCGGS